MPPARRAAAQPASEVPATGPFESYGLDYDFLYADQSSWLGARESLLLEGPVFMRPNNLIVAALVDKPSVIGGGRLESSYSFLDYLFAGALVPY